MRSIYCITALLIATSAFARIGETEQQIEARYGKPIKLIGGVPPGLEGIKRYQSAGLDIYVNFISGLSEEEYYSKQYGKIERAEVDAILQANSQGKEWKEIPSGHPLYSWRATRWMLGEINPESTLAEFDGGRLTIMTKKFLDASRAASADAAKEKLKGF
jgi:hypothetical protein